MRHLRPVSRGRREKTVHVETDGETVGDLRRDLEAASLALAGELVDEGGLVGSIVVTADGRAVRRLGGLDTALEGTATYRLVPSVYGG